MTKGSDLEDRCVAMHDRMKVIAGLAPDEPREALCDKIWAANKAT
jgi:hypothetical protein